MTLPKFVQASASVDGGFFGRFVRLREAAACFGEVSTRDDLKWFPFFLLVFEALSAVINVF